MSTIDRAARFALLALLATAVGACSSDSPSEPDGDDPRVVKQNPSFANDIQDVFTRNGCASSGCHGGAGGSGGLNLSGSAAYDALVGVMAVAEPVTRVIPGNATDSYLVIRLEGRQTVGNRMPLGGSPLDNIDLTNVRNWIAQGAQRN
ncbi:MAG: hypothetical protein KJO11_03715 [Gemmatimonadetes bacterium]|nr:hypothetical protein [Gemmatimonadota bacterium]